MVSPMRRMFYVCAASTAASAGKKLRLFEFAHNPEGVRGQLDQAAFFLSFEECGGGER